MKRLSFWAFLIAFPFILSANSLMAQSDMMILDTSRGLSGKKRPPVPFPHNLHVEKGLSCKDCHHLYKKGENVLDESNLTEGNKEIRCSSCHGSKSRLNLEQAYHEQCMGCHKKPLKEQKKAPPRYCGGCHVRK
ncbi:MAG: cytochrome c3 family protein [Deltaproteobacteria bacterium]|nr:cytochrome c3 family protein [Deltaproteobacteria bacterium]MDP3015912.1 cytochrome c3 family protein [Deltaproteobacteria bacterium]